MEWLEVLRRVQEGEGRTTEFKSRFDKDAVGKAICAFANGVGGVVILGVDDSGAIVGVAEDPEHLQETITTFLQTGCSTPVGADCGRYRTQEGWIHWIDVPRLRGLEPLSHRGRYWIRRGRSSVEPSPVERQELFNTFGFIHTELQVISDGGFESIDIATFQDFLTRRGVDIESSPQPEMELDLVSHRVVQLFNGQIRPTLYGLMVFGHNPQRYLQTANFFIQCVAYRGDERGPDAYSISEGVGAIHRQVDLAMTWFRGLGRRETYDGLYRRDLPLAPENVIREALVNAVIHRDYTITGGKVMFEVFDSHIAVTSPGALPDHMTVEDVKVGVGPRSRNEFMANAMVVWQLMEQRGRGWPSMRHWMREFNGTEPELVNNQSSRIVRVTLRLDGLTS